MKQSDLRFVEPMECLMVSKLPEGADWRYEIKLDGYRAQAVCQASGTQLLSRNGKDLGKRFPPVVAALAKAIPHGSIVDGELVALDAEGKPSFSLIQNSATSGATFVFFAFDLLALAGADLTRKPLSERQAQLSKALTKWHNYGPPSPQPCECGRRWQHRRLPTGCAKGGTDSSFHALHGPAISTADKESPRRLVGTCGR